MRGTGKTTASLRLQSIGEVIDVELLQYTAAAALEPASAQKERYAWEFWSEDRLKRLPTELDNAFLANYGPDGMELPYVVFVASVLVKDWFLCPLMEVLARHRPGLRWPSENFLVLDYPSAEIHHRIRHRDREHERSLTLQDVETESRGYRESHVNRSIFDWRLLPDQAALDAEIRRLKSS